MGFCKDDLGRKWKGTLLTNLFALQQVYDLENTAAKASGKKQIIFSRESDVFALELIRADAPHEAG